MKAWRRVVFHSVKDVAASGATVRVCAHRSLLFTQMETLFSPNCLEITNDVKRNAAAAAASRLFAWR